MNAGAPIGRSVPTPLVALVVLLLLKSDGMPITMSTKGSHSWLLYCVDLVCCFVLLAFTIVLSDLRFTALVSYTFLIADVASYKYQTTDIWPRQKEQNDKQQSTKHYVEK
jgi:hypothetical protein